MFGTTRNLSSQPFESNVRNVRNDVSRTLPLYNNEFLTGQLQNPLSTLCSMNLSGLLAPPATFLFSRYSILEGFCSLSKTLKEVSMQFREPHWVGRNEA